MKQLTFTLALIGSLFFSKLGAQQTGGKISGTVVDDSRAAVTSASVSLLKSNDSSLVKIAVADKAGNFVIENVGEGQYLVSVTSSSYAKSYSPPFKLSADNSDIRLGIITLAKKITSLSNVTVVSKTPLIEQKIDRTVLNVEAAITNAGSTALEVLEKAPGISVDKDGNISLKGKAGVMVLIDGRPTQLGAADLANMLRSMQSSQLDQIEIMTNPPAKYDAAGNAGIINIKTKKNKQFGYNGSVTAGIAQGKGTRFNEGLNFNYRKNKVNFFTNLSHNRNIRIDQLNIQRNFLHNATKNVLYRFEQVGDMTNTRNSYNGKVGLDYSFNPKTSIGVVVSGFSSPNTFNNLNTTNRIEGSNVTEQTKSISRSKGTFQNFSSNLNFRRQLDTTGKEITADLDYLTYNGRTNMSLLSDYYNAAGSKRESSDTLFGGLPQIINIYSGKLDYTHPLKKGARFEAGLKTSLVNTDNNAVYDTANNGLRQRDLGRSNHFVYEENINAAYVNLSMPLGKKWNGQFGLRAENTNAKGDQKTTGEKFKRNYTQLFPTAYLQYKMNKQNDLGINYGRRIRRPNYESLNPFIEFLDRYTFEQGNPNLKPQFSHNVELSHTYKSFLTTT
jgi:hypothetical protein